MRYEKINAEETQVYDQNCIVLGSIKRETAPPGVPAAWVYRYWPKGVTSVTQATSAFQTIDQLKKKLESK